MEPSLPRRPTPRRDKFCATAKRAEAIEHRLQHVAPLATGWCFSGTCGLAAAFHVIPWRRRHA